MVDIDKIKCIKCLDTKEYWDEDLQQLIKCDCLPESTKLEILEDIDNEEYEDGNGY